MSSDLLAALGFGLLLAALAWMVSPLARVRLRAAAGRAVLVLVLIAVVLGAADTSP